MPGLQKLPSFKNRKAFCLPPSDETKTFEEQGKRASMRKARFFFTDPDATESSSDEQDNERSMGLARKRFVRELLIPAVHPVGSNSDVEAGCCRKTYMAKDGEPVPARKRPFPCTKFQTSPKEKSSRTSCKKGTKKSGSGVSKKPFRYIGLKQRRMGKWTAELRDLAKGCRTQVRAFDSSLKLTSVNDEAARLVQHSKAITDFQGSEFHSSLNFQDAPTGSGNASFSDHFDMLEDGMLEDEFELLPMCSDLEAIEDCFLAYSPSSVLEHPNSSGGSYSASSPCSGLESGVSDDYSSTALELSERLLPAERSGEAASSSDVLSPSLESEDHHVDSDLSVPNDQDTGHEKLEMQESSLWKVFDDLDDCEGLHVSHEAMTIFLDEFQAIDGNDEACLMGFELDAEALAWINMEA